MVTRKLNTHASTPTSTNAGEGGGVLYTARWRRGRQGPRTLPAGVSNWAAAHEFYYFYFISFFKFEQKLKYEQFSSLNRKIKI
jgi:hypothetical protein